jgi:hypothetical protein
MNSKQRKQVQKTFIESLLKDSNVSLACEVAGIGRTTAYNWRNEDKEFATDWDDAIERARDIARQSIYARGIIGWDEPVVSMGQAVYEYEPILDEQNEPILDSKGKPVTRKTRLMVHKWSDSLAALYAKANLPEYKEKQQIEHSGSIDINGAKEELLAKLSNMIRSVDAAPDKEHKTE